MKCTLRLYLCMILSNYKYDTCYHIQIQQNLRELERNINLTYFVYFEIISIRDGALLESLIISF